MTASIPASDLEQRTVNTAYQTPLAMHMELANAFQGIMILTVRSTVLICVIVIVMDLDVQVLRHAIVMGVSKMRSVTTTDTANAQNIGAVMTAQSTSPYVILSVMDVMDQPPVTAQNVSSTATWPMTPVFAMRTGQRKTALSTSENAITFARKTTAMAQRAVTATTVGNMPTLTNATIVCATMIMKECIARTM